MKKVSILVGSLRRLSYARRIAKNTIKMFPENYQVEIVEIGDLPLYNNDYDNPDEAIEVPDSYKQFRQQIAASDIVLFVTAENNRTIPACLKNAVDICSKADVAMKDKVAGIISHSVGKMGGYSSNKNLRLALSYFDMKIPGQPEAFIGNSHDLFDGDSDVLNNQSTIDFIQKYIDNVVELAEK